MWGKFPIYQSFRKRAPIVCLGDPPAAEVKIYPNPMKIAVQYKEMLESGFINSQTELAHLLGVSRAKVTQMLNLLKLDEEIQDFILGLEETDERLKVLTERKLRPLAQIREPKIQQERFEELVGCEINANGSEVCEGKAGAA